MRYAISLTQDVLLLTALLRMAYRGIAIVLGESFLLASASLPGGGQSRN